MNWFFKYILCAYWLKFRGCTSARHACVVENLLVAFYDILNGYVCVFFTLYSHPSSLKCLNCTNPCVCVCELMIEKFFFYVLLLLPKKKAARNHTCRQFGWWCVDAVCRVCTVHKEIGEQMSVRLMESGKYITAVATHEKRAVQNEKTTQIEERNTRTHKNNRVLVNVCTVSAWPLWFGTNARYRLHCSILIG